MEPSSPPSGSQSLYITDMKVAGAFKMGSLSVFLCDVAFVAMVALA